MEDRVQEEKLLLIPFGKIQCSEKEKITQLIYKIKDNQVFVILRDILCCICNYYDRDHKILSYFLDLFLDIVNMTISDIYDHLLQKSSISNWNDIFSYSCDYNKIFDIKSQYHDREIKISKYPYEHELTNNVLSAIPYSSDGGLSPYVIMYLKNLLYMQHGSYFDIDVIESIFEDGYLKAAVDRTEQYPGVYANLIEETWPVKTNFRKDIVYLILPLYLLKSSAWFAEPRDVHGTISETTITSQTMLDYISSSPEDDIDLGEIIFQYNISLSDVIHVVCHDELYDILKPIVGNKLVKSKDFISRRYIDDLFIENNYDKRKLRLDYAPPTEHSPLLSFKSLYNILLNSGNTKDEAKMLVRNTDREKLMLSIHENFFDNFNKNTSHKVVVHPPW